MGSIYIDPASAQQASAKLIGASSNLLDAANSASRALSHTAGLPPEFVGDAHSLAGLVRAKTGRMADLCAVEGLELDQRAKLAIQEQNSPGLGGAKGPLAALGKRPSLATSTKINFWNKPTQAAVTRRPGALATALHNIISPPPKTKAGTRPKLGEVKLQLKGPEFEHKLGLSIEKIREHGGNPDEIKLLEKLKNIDPSRLTPEMMQKLQDSGALRDLEVFGGIKLEGKAGSIAATVALGNNYDIKADAVVKGNAQLGVTAGAGKDGVSAGAGAGVSVSAETSISAGNDQVRVQGTAAGEAGLEAHANVAAKIEDGHVTANYDIGAAVGVGGSLKGGIDIDLGKISSSLHHHDSAPVAHRPVATQRPDGVLVIGSR